MAHDLRMCTAFIEAGVKNEGPTFLSSLLPVTLDPRNHITSSGFHRH